MLCAPSQISSGDSARRSSRPGSVHRLRGGRVDRPAEEGLGRGDGEGDVAAPREPRSSPRPTSGRAPATRLAEDDERALRTTASFSAAISVPRLAELLGVLEPDVREHDHRRAEDVRRVQPPAEPRLDHGRVDPLLGEVRERGGGQRLELRRTDPLRRGPDARDRAFEALRVGVEPLVPAGDMRRGVGPDPEPLGTEERRRQPRRRRLAVRADDVDRRERLLRIVELGEERVHPVEPELLGPRRERGDPGGGASPRSRSGRSATHRRTR